jgi:hypothetical protein
MYMCKPTIDNIIIHEIHKTQKKLTRHVVASSVFSESGTMFPFTFVSGIQRWGGEMVAAGRRRLGRWWAGRPGRWWAGRRQAGNPVAAFGCRLTDGDLEGGIWPPAACSAGWAAVACRMRWSEIVVAAAVFFSHVGCGVRVGCVLLFPHGMDGSAWCFFPGQSLRCHCNFQ